MSARYIITIPKSITLIHNKDKNFIILVGLKQIRHLELKLKISIKHSNSLKITSKSVFPVSNAEKKKLKSLQGSTIALLNQLLMEMLYDAYKKLKFVGVGYRAFAVTKINFNLLRFKLGFSHYVYFKIPDELSFFCIKMTKLYVFGNSYHNVSQTCALIRLCKKPEPYKGKGILYQSEIVKLKIGKRV